MRVVSALKNSQGQSLIEAMIVIAVLGVTMVGFMSMIAYQSSEVRSLKERIAVEDFQQQLTRSFADGSLCTYLMAGANPVKFNVPSGGATAQNPAKADLPFQAIPLTPSANSPVLIKAGEAYSPIATTAVVPESKPFQLTNIVGTVTAGVGQFTANLQVNLDQTKLIRALIPASTQVTLQTSAAGNTQTVTGCKIANLSQCQFRTASQGSGFLSQATVYCHANESLVGGTASCASTTGRMFGNQSQFASPNGWFASCAYEQGPNYVTSVATATAFCCPN